MPRLVGSLPLLLVLILCGSAAARDAPPKVQVYSRAPRQFEHNNTLLCHASGFHPPEVSLELLRNGQPMEDGQQGALAFDQTWQYHLTIAAPFTPEGGDQFSCRVTHLKTTNTHIWDPDM